MHFIFHFNLLPVFFGVLQVRNGLNRLKVLNLGQNGLLEVLLFSILV